MTGTRSLLREYLWKRGGGNKYDNERIGAGILADGTVVLPTKDLKK